MAAVNARTPRALAALLVAGAFLAACGDATAETAQPTASASETPAGPMPIIIDTDLDLSDAAALLALVLDPRVEVRAITITTAGTGVTKCGSARKVMGYLLDEIGRDEIPFACGGADPGGDALVFPAEWRTPADSGWGLDIPPRPETGTAETAVDLLVRTVDQASAPITLVALGPWTNLAAAAATDASFLAGVARIHAMAGSVDAPGNVFVDDITADDRLEWNVVLDPSAFVAILGSDVPITLVPLDATDDVPATEALKSRLGESGAGGANLVYELWLRVPGRIGEGQQLWDELAALAVMEPELAGWEDLTLATDASGRLTRSDAGRKIRVAVSADAAAVENALLEALERGGARATPFALQGSIAATWDGESCAAEAPSNLAAGMADLQFTNTSGAVAGVTIIGLRDPHTWADLEEFLRTFDPTTAQEPPDWVVVAGSASDDAGEQLPVHGTAIMKAGTYGPVCLFGDWPDIGISAGDSFEVRP